MSEIEITPELLADLKEKAKAAKKENPLPWSIRRYGDDYTPVYDGNNKHVAIDCIDSESTYIVAVNPDVCLAMIEENKILLRALRNCFHMPPSFAEEFAEKFVADQIETARKQIDEEGDIDEQH